jgi:hypothetical protein
VEATPCVLTVQVAPLLRTALSQCHVPGSGRGESEAQILPPNQSFQALEWDLWFPSVWMV